MDPDKRQMRKLKRSVKKAGARKRRGQLKRDLRDNPEEAHHSEIRYGRNSSQTLNGLDNDRTRSPVDDTN